MSAEGESSPNHAVVPTEAPGMASAVDMATNKHILDSLNNNDQTMGQMAGLQPNFAKIASQVAGKGQKEPPINTQLAEFQREQIKPALKQEYSTICSTEVPLTSQYLFGDELAKQLRHARESSKISHSVGHSSQQCPYTGNHRSVLERYNRLMETFYGKVNTDPTERKSLRSTKRNHWPTVSNKRFGK